MFFPLCTPGSNKEFMWYFGSRNKTLQWSNWIKHTFISYTVSFSWVAFKASLGFVVYCFPSRSKHSWYSDRAYQAFLHIATIGGTSTPWPPLPPKPLCQHSIRSLDGWECDDFDTLVTLETTLPLLHCRVGDTRRKYEMVQSIWRLQCRLWQTNRYWL